MSESKTFKIKSLYNIKEVFSFLKGKYDKQILKLIKYNKELQNIFSVDIEVYSIISGIKVINKENGDVCEYNLETNKLEFEG